MLFKSALKAFCLHRFGLFDVQWTGDFLSILFYFNLISFINNLSVKESRTLYSIKSSTNLLQNLEFVGLTTFSSVLFMRENIIVKGPPIMNFLVKV